MLVMCPVMAKHLRVQAFLDQLQGRGREIAGMVAMAEFLSWLGTVKVQMIGGVFLCSYYLTSLDWDVWVSTEDPRTQAVRFTGSWLFP